MFVHRLLVLRAEQIRLRPARIAETGHGIFVGVPRSRPAHISNVILSNVFVLGGVLQSRFNGPIPCRHPAAPEPALITDENFFMQRGGVHRPVQAEVGVGL